MGYAIVAGGLLLLYFGAKGGTTLGTAATAIAGAVRGQVKLGNADPNFEPWLAQETEKLLGPVSGAAAFRATDHQQFADAVRARRLLVYDKQATSRGSGSLSLASPQGVGRIAGLGTQSISLGFNIAGKTAGTLAKAIPIIGSAIGIATEIIGAFTAHHAAAVQLEQNTLYTVEPSANQALAQLDTAYRQGQISGAQMKSALEELYQSFTAALAMISQPPVFDAAGTITSHHCNAGCTQERVLRGIIDAMELFDY